MNPNLEHKLSHLPTDPGCYLYKDAHGKIIYIGKAKNLKNRIKSYFANIGRHQQFKTEILVKKISDLEYIITDTELEALVLEANLIKKHKPKYNIDLKDDKSYPYIRITREQYPQIYITRNIVQDGSRYLGPYTNVRAIRELLTSLKKTFLIRQCDLLITDESIRQKKHKLCLNYQIKICSGVCNGLEDSVSYNEKLKQIIAFLTGTDKDIAGELKEKMEAAAHELNFESAARYRDQIKVLNDFGSRQKVENADQTARDYIALAREDNDACCVVFKVRNGRLIGRNHYFLDGVFQKEPAKIISEFISVYYSQTDYDYPEELMLQQEVEDADILKEWLSSLRGRVVNLVLPKIGEKSKLLFLAEKNGQLLLNDMKLEKLKKDFTPRSLISLQRDLKLEKLPVIIECFDISHFAGRETVASMVCFKNAKPFKSRYRKFKINTVEYIDDFASMREVVERRYSRLVKEQDAENPLPDLIMVDGGKGQLSSAVEIMSRLGLGHIPIIGLAKRLEEVFKPGESEPEMIPRTSSAIKLLQQVRDEAHRFAITYHKLLRGKEQVASELDEIPGIGPAKRTALIKHFGSVAGIKKADKEQLQAVKGISSVNAKTIIAHWSKNNYSEDDNSIIEESAKDLDIIIDIN